ncbi:prolipoprotein diacylglyceryl transferase [soil metagenome]
MSIPSPDTAFQIFVIPIGQWLHGIGVPSTFAISIHAYALCILVGIIAAVIMTSKRLTARGAEPGVTLDIILWAIPLGIIGARIFHVITHPDDYFAKGDDLLKTLYIWEGGLAIFGGLILGAVGVFIGCRISGIRFWTFADALAPGLLLAQAFGRFGNYFNHELFGLPTSAPWGLQIESTNPAYPIGLPAGVLFQPTFIYEIVWNVLGMIVILVLARRLTLQWGKQLAVYLIWYGAGRIVWENIRIDPSLIFFGLRTNVWVAILAVVLGIVIFAVQSRRHVGLEPSPYRTGREWVGPSAGVDSAETYTDTDEPGDAGKGNGATSTSPGSKSTLATSTAGTSS